MATFKEYVLGARPKTLSAAIVPVLLGSSLAYWQTDSFSVDIGIACLVVALSLQIGVNFANDYSDGIKGTDENRVGPMRLVGSGKAKPKSVLIAMLISLLIGSLSGIYVAWQSSWWLVVIGIFCVLLAWFYTGSKHPYGYYGFGELAVFICFGLVATMGTYFALTQTISKESFYAGCISGMFSVAILLANNIRDVPTDKVSGKKTLAVRIGAEKAKIVFLLSLIFVAISTILLSMSINEMWFVFPLFVLLGIIAWKMFRAEKPPEFISILVFTSQLNLAYGVLVSGLILVSAS